MTVVELLELVLKGFLVAIGFAIGAIVVLIAIDIVTRVIRAWRRTKGKQE